LSPAQSLLHKISSETTDAPVGNGNADHCVMSATAMLRVFDCVCHLSIPEPTVWQRLGNQIKAAFIFARSDFVNVQPFRSAVLNIRPGLVIFVEEHFIELALVYHFAAVPALVEVFFFRVGQLLKVSVVHRYSIARHSHPLFAHSGRDGDFSPLAGFENPSRE
jgi:hypothetical protein